MKINNSATNICDALNITDEEYEKFTKIISGHYRCISSAEKNTYKISNSVEFFVEQYDKHGDKFLLVYIWESIHHKLFADRQRILMDAQYNLINLYRALFVCDEDDNEDSDDEGCGGVLVN